MTPAHSSLTRPPGEPAEVEVVRVPAQPTLTGLHLDPHGRLAIYASGVGLRVEMTPAECRALSIMLAEVAGLLEAGQRGGVVVPATGTA